MGVYSQKSVCAHDAASTHGLLCALKTYTLYGINILSHFDSLSITTDISRFSSSRMGGFSLHALFSHMGGYF